MGIRLGNLFSRAAAADPVFLVDPATGLPVAGTGGGAMTVADGADEALGSVDDEAYSGSGAGSAIAILKGIFGLGGGGGGSGASATATAAAPTYAEGASVDLSTDLDGNLRTADASALEQLELIATAAADTTTPVSVFASGREYEFVAASSSFAALGATGAAGDDLDSIIFIPLTTSPGEVKLRDGTSGTARTIFKGGADSLTSLQPFEIGLCLKSLASGGWFLDTGANIQCYAAGNFT